MSEKKPVEYWLGKLRLWMKLHPEPEHNQFTILYNCWNCPHLSIDEDKNISTCLKTKTERIFANKNFTKAIYSKSSNGLYWQNKVKFYCLEWIKHV